MSSASSCHFCARANPAGSKFCNHCGEPLDLKPCSHCEAFNHVLVDRCYQCDAPFESKAATLVVAETGNVARSVDTRRGAVPQAASAATLAEPGAAPVGRVPASRASRIEPSLGPLERIPVALSERMEAGSERLAEPVNDAPPLMPLAAGAVDAEADDEANWVDPRRERAARLELRVRRRARAFYAAVAAAVVCAAATVGYLAYDAKMLPDAAEWARTAERSVVASSAAVVDEVKREIARAPEALPPAPTLPTPAPAASDAAPSDAAPSDAAPGNAQPAPTSSGPPQVSPATPSDATQPPSAKSSEPMEPPSATSSEATPSPAATASQPDSRPSNTVHKGAPRRPAAKPPRTEAARPTVDKDAVATKRLIERDLAGFLPPRPAEPAPPR